LETARQSDFYTVELRDLDPMGIERALSDVEGKCAPIIRDTVAAQRLPIGEELDVLLNFVSISVVRVPSWRATISSHIDRVIKRLAETAFLGPSGAKRLRKSLESSGRRVTDEEIGRLQAFVVSGEYDADFERNWHVWMMLEANKVLLRLLAMRHWSVWVVDDGVPDLVCSDRPVALMSRYELPGGLSPSFGTPNTMLTIPLSKRVALVSYLEEIPDRYIMDQEDVALVNTLTGLWGNQIYSAEADWIWSMGVGKFGGAGEYLQSFQQADPP